MDTFHFTSNRLSNLVAKVEIEFYSGADGADGNEENITWAYTTAQTGEANLVIHINELFGLRVAALGRDDQIYRSVTWFEAICLLHELGHLMQRWNQVEKTPDTIIEAGIQMETCVFGFGIYILYRVVDNETHFIGVAANVIFKIREIDPMFIDRVFRSIVYGDVGIQVEINRPEFLPFRELPEDIRTKGILEENEKEGLKLPEGVCVGLCRRARERKLFPPGTTPKSVRFNLVIKLFNANFKIVLFLFSKAKK